MNFDVESIEKAVHQFYYVPANSLEAHQWLTLAQTNVDAWNFCWQLIQPHKAQEVQFFGANTLHLKVTRFWSELSEDQYPELKEKLFQHIIIYIPHAPNIIMTRLCIVLSCYIIRTIPAIWTTAIEDVIKFFQSDGIQKMAPENSISVLFNLLRVIPEEFQTITLTQSFRGLVRHHLELNSNLVLSLIQRCLNESSNLSLTAQALECLRSWIVFGVSLLDCAPLIDMIVYFVAVKDVTIIACDVLINIVTHPDCSKYSASIMSLLDKILKLENLLLEAAHKKDVEMCASLYNLFTSFGENHSKLLLDEFLKEDDTKEKVMKLVHIILSCSGAAGQYPIDESYSSLAFGFWYNLQDDIVRADAKKRQIYMIHFISAFESLVDVLLQKLIAPKAKNYPTWTSEEIEQFRCYHQDIGDTLMYCFSLLRTRMLERLLGHLNYIISRCKNNEDIQEPLAACLFAFQSIAENVDIDDNVYISGFLAAIVTIPFNGNADVIAAVLDAIGAYAEWINNNPNVLPQIVPLLMLGLNYPESSPSATMALKDICRDCQLHLRPFANEILMTCGEVFSKQTLKFHEQMRLMGAIGYVLSLLRFEEIGLYMNSLLTPIYQGLQQCCQETQLTLTLQTEIVKRLAVLSVLLGTLNTKLKEDDDAPSEQRNAGDLQNEEADKHPQPVLTALQQLLPILHQLVARWPTCSPIMDEVCDVMKRSISNLLDDAVPILDSVLTLIQNIYRSLANGLTLDLFKLIALIFHDKPNHVLQIQNTLLVIINSTMLLSQKGLSETSDIAEGFCYLLAQLLKKQPDYLNDENINLLTLFQYGVAVLAIPEAQAVKASASYLVNFISVSRNYPVMLNIMNNYGENLLLQILTCIGGSSPRRVMDSITDVLLTMLKKYFDNSCRWLNSMMSRENFPSAQVNKAEKELFVKSVIKNHTNKRRLQEIVKQFTLSCRGLIGTEYAEQTLNTL